MSKPSIDSILQSQIKLIKPKNIFTKDVSLMIEKINSLLKKSNIDAICTTGGSYAKGTIIGDSFDVDLFVRFNFEKYKNSDISNFLGKAIMSLKPERVHGSRDYFHIRKGKVLFEIIPVLMISDYSSAKNVTDMSPLHVGFANSKFDKNKNLRNDVMLTKQFMKSIGVYGAESHIKGFSGHVVDLLVIYYGGFVNLLMQASVWSDTVIIDINNLLKNPLQELNSSKTKCPMIIVDPVQPDRNSSAALSIEAFEKFKLNAREFLKNPSNEFFKIRKIDLSKLKKDYKKEVVIILKVIPLPGKNDVSGSKVLKVFDFIKDSLEEYDFNLINFNWEFGKSSTLYFVVRKEKLSVEITSQGPYLKDSSNVSLFKKKHKKTFEQNGRIFAKEKREFLDAKKLVQTLIKKPFVKERVKKIIFS